MLKKGCVYLVGAGPGDPGLITVKGAERLNNAEVVVYDHLLDETLLDLSPATAERLYVGKSAGHHALEQDEINRLLVEKARAGKKVVRLKGGDPFVFGRGGEEAACLAENGVDFEVVPGVTSAVAVPAYAGIPVTHRGLASSFAVVTGHEDPAKDGSSIDWEHLAKSVDTLVFLMGRENLPQIMAKLKENGRSADTPVAVVRDGTRAAQETVTGTIADIAGRVQAKGMKPPVIIIVGRVVELRDILRWFDRKPLSGKRVLVTRARHQASRLSELLAERGAVPLELPAIEIQPADALELKSALRSVKSFDWLVLTSTNGVLALFSALAEMKTDASAFGGVRTVAIGPATAQVLASRGLAADFVPSEFSAAGIIAGMKKMNVAGQRFLLLRADIADAELTAGLSALGANVREVAAYRTVPAAGSIARAREMLRSGSIDVVTFASSSTVANLMSALDGDRALLHGVTVACIGPKTAQTALDCGLRVDVMASEYTIPGLVAALEQYFGREVADGIS